jgi:methenyltetrahydrofolate cyclohydrolase
MSLLMDYSLRDFNKLLSSCEPAPGGGSTAALSGVLGTALSIMVVNLSIGKKAFEGLEEGTKAKIKEDFEKLKELNDELVELVDEDTRAFNSFMEAMKLPKNTEEERSNRAQKLQKASIYALEVPLKVAEKCLLVLKHQLSIVKYGNKNAVSDVGVGAILSLAGLEGAALNVKINLPGIDVAGIKEDALENIENYLEEGNKLKAEIMAVVNERIG